MSAESSLLFEPIRIGKMDLSHRVVLAPLTRYKATKSHVPILPLVGEYYSQRSSVGGTLLISEATLIAPQAAGAGTVPGIWSDEQIQAWKQVTDRVHANKSFIFLQLWASGRAAKDKDLKTDDPSFSVVAPSPIPLKSQPDVIPHELTIAEIHEYVRLYAQAAKNAIFEAGFDGVEVHGANGYLVDQFLQDVSNQRTDEYGGSIEGRSRFGLEVMDAVVEAVGAERAAIRLSPWSTFQDMAMKDPVPQFSHFVSALKQRHPDLAYVHTVEPRVMGGTDRQQGPNESNNFLHDIWSPLPVIRAGGYSRETAMRDASAGGALIAFGRIFIANPDLPKRLEYEIPLTPYDRSTFYLPGNVERGYTDYAFAEPRKH